MVGRAPAKMGQTPVQVRQVLGNAGESTSWDEQMSHLANNTAQTMHIFIWANSKFFVFLSFFIICTN